MKKLSKLLCLLLAMSMFLSAAGFAEAPDSGEDTEATETVEATEPTKDTKATDGTETADQATNESETQDAAATPAQEKERGVIYRQNYGTNATQLPITTDDVTLVVWREFTSTIMEDLSESLTFQELEKRTGVKVEFVYPPVNQVEENFSLRVASGDLPHMFSNPPEYKGGYDKGVDDGVYLPINEYMEKGFTPNLKYLFENYPDIAKDMTLDSGLIVGWHMLDYVPSSPWSGLWVRQDMLEECGLEPPKTIDDWTNMLRTFKEKYGAVLGCNIKDWYGVATNYQFVSSYDTGYEWFAKDGKTATFGPIEPGYKDFLTLLNQWYAEGLLDPDFSTNTHEAFQAKMADGTYGAFGSAYGEIGQAKVTGMNANPNYKLLAVPQPTSRDGQTIHLRQADRTVRDGDKDIFTYRCVDEGIADVAMQWKDYWYSQEGGDLMSYGPEGVSYEWQEDNTLKWIYEDTGVIEKGEDKDFWTVYPKFKLHNWGYLRDSTAYEMQPEVWQAIEAWGTVEPDWFMPPVAHTPEESEELSRIMTDIKTYREEMTYKFISGQEPLENFEMFVENIKSMNIDGAIKIKQDALDRYLAR